MEDDEDDNKLNDGDDEDDNSTNGENKYENTSNSLVDGDNDDNNHSYDEQDSNQGIHCEDQVTTYEGQAPIYEEETNASGESEDESEEKASLNKEGVTAYNKQETEPEHEASTCEEQAYENDDDVIAEQSD
ncbi:MAG: hypothetical protein LQ342_008084 [Letrouitia transgressa]|nr:MAG: hypothetical protein LQ342_008084 [Letrouitia transgressa]